MGSYRAAIKPIRRMAMRKTIALAALFGAMLLFTGYGAYVYDDDKDGKVDSSYISLEYMVPVWAEENAAIAANTYEWAFGNGANTPSDGGITIYVPTGWSCFAVAMSLRIGGGTATVELVHNGTPKGEDAQVVLSSGQSATAELDTPLAISNNDFINFRTSAAAGTSGPCVATVWLKYTKN